MYILINLNKLIILTLKLCYLINNQNVKKK